MEKQYKDIAQLVKEAGLEKPSLDFLQNVMNSVEITSKKTTTTTAYQPLVSRRGWVVVCLFVASILTGLLLSADSGSSILEPLNLSLPYFKDIKNSFSSFTLHATTMYGTVFAALLFVVQITILKRRIDKTFSS